MPELPEVEAARQLLHDFCRGKRVEKAVCADDDKVIQGVSPADLQKALQGKTIKDALRKGKNLWLEFHEGPPALMFHLGMTGSLAVKGIPRVQYVNATNANDEWPPKYWKITLEMEGGVHAAFCDPRRFGRVKQSADVAAELAHLGFDPLLSMPALDAFAAMLAKERRGIKALLLDQAFSAGVGNWVADEVLYQARIHPEQKASTLTAEQASALHEQLQGVLQVAVKAGADSEKYPPGWLFHQKWTAGRGKGPAPTLDGHRIEVAKVAGRTTAFVPDLQKLPAGAQSAGRKAATKKAPEGEAPSAMPARARKAPGKRRKPEEREDDEDEADAEGQEEEEDCSVTT
ncbi:hypothetical protein WJX81_007673 [Elliptochloris bilobata]|uniref:Formamidopyrimidine-DNA glycosylase catalytic domain-containing protein n=1 Tax=Elliptochloris bilobata TaxID=381761 RepID=A0AAW1QZ34_9CHLO